MVTPTPTPTPTLGGAVAAGTHDAVPGMPPSLRTLAPKELRQRLRALQDASASNDTLAYRLKLKPETLQAQFDAVCALCKKGDFKRAHDAAMDLFLVQPTDWRYSYLVGTCRQRMGKPDAAAVYFAISFEVGGTPMAIFRLGECMKACGYSDEAIHAFDKAAALAQADPKLADLKVRATELATSMLKRDLERRGADQRSHK